MLYNTKKPKKQKITSFLQKAHKNRFISIDSHYIKNPYKHPVSLKKYMEKNCQNRSKSFQTVKKINLSKFSKKSNKTTRINSQRHIQLNQTIKRRNEVRNEVKKEVKSQKKAQYFNNRSDISKFKTPLSTPKFGQNPLNSQNLTSLRLDLLFQLQQIKNSFAQNLQSIKLSILQKLSPHKNNLTKYLYKNSMLLNQQWFLIKKSFAKAVNQRDILDVENMIREWNRKRLRVKELKENLEKAFQLLLL